MLEILFKRDCLMKNKIVRYKNYKSEITSLLD